MKAAKDPNTEVGLTVRSTAREHGKQGENKECVIGSPTDRRTSVYSVDNDDTRKEPTEGPHGAERVGTRRRTRRGDSQTEGGTHAANKGRAIGSMTTFARTTTTDEKEGVSTGHG